jgi:hypothetical protein
MKQKIAITFPHLHHFGGGEIFCEYVTNYLSSYYDIDLYYYNVGKINSKLKISKKVNLFPVNSSFFFFNFLCSKFIALAQFFLIIFFLKEKKKYKFIFSAAGEFVSARYKVIQYIHHPFYSLNPLHFFSIGVKMFEIHKLFLRFLLSFIVRVYFILNNEYFRRNITLVNSLWTKIRYKNIYNHNKVYLVYPTFKIPELFLENFDKFEKRKNDFVLLGRVSADKNTFKAINFFIKFKKNNSNLNIGVLHVVGPNNNSLIKKINYYKINYKNFIKFHNYLSLKQRNKILKKSKYGLHFSHDEHFGRAILEMTKFRLIVFAENSGGCREILLNSFQKYKCSDDLIVKLSKVMQSKIIRKKIFDLVFKNLNKKFTDLNFKNELKKYLVY